MKKRLLYLYLKSGDYSEIIAFLQMYEKVDFQKINTGVLIAAADMDFSLLEFKLLRELIMEELLLDFVGLYVPIDFDVPIEELLSGFQKLGNQVYDIAKFITEVVLSKDIALHKRLKTYYYNTIGIDNINTVVGFVKNNFNASLTAKKLFLHRNTLNYRLENFVYKSEMDIKTFSVGLAIYLLFER